MSSREDQYSELRFSEVDDPQDIQEVPENEDEQHENDNINQYE